MSQRSIELLVGRLVTDEAFRIAFVRDPRTTVGAFMESGRELTAVEIQAIIGGDPQFWAGMAERIDPRLQKVSLK